MAKIHYKPNPCNVPKLDAEYTDDKNNVTCKWCQLKNDIGKNSIRENFDGYSNIIKSQQKIKTNDCEPLKEKLTENRFIRLFLYGMNRDFKNHKPLNPTPEQGLTIQIELEQLFENIKKDIKSAVDFYKKYKSPYSIDDFQKEEPKEFKKFTTWLEKKGMPVFSQRIVLKEYMDEYPDWLFDYIFEDVIDRNKIGNKYRICKLCNSTLKSNEGTICNICIQVVVEGYVKKECRNCKFWNKKSTKIYKCHCGDCPDCIRDRLKQKM